MTFCTFDHILLLGRPAAGKSEFIAFLKGAPERERADSLHIGKFEEQDDFVWFWEKFMEDDLWEEAGYKRFFSHREGNNRGLNEDSGHLFDLMLARFNRVVREKYSSRPEFYNDGTLFIEFSRGTEFDYRHSLPKLSKEIIDRAVILYIDVSYQESKRRNDARYAEKLKYSILAHKATDRVMEAFYKHDDWAELTGGKKEGHVEMNGVKVPFVTVFNEPEVKDAASLSARYKPALDKLFNLWEAK